MASNPAFRQSVRPSQPVKNDFENEELRVQVNTLRYELDNLKQERDLTELRHEKELRDLQLRADSDFRKAQTAEAASNRANQKSEALAKELKESQESALSEKAVFERRIRTLQDQNQSLQDEATEIEAQRADQERQFKRQITELDTLRITLAQTLDDVQRGMQNVQNSLHSANAQVSKLENDVATLEAENLRLRAEGSGAEELAVLKRELSEQVAHIKNLESTNREQAAELRHLRKVQKNVEVVEEQKKSLENQLQLMSNLEAEFGNVQIQNQVLEDERRSWTSMLESNSDFADFDSPEAVVKALVEERIEKLTLIDKLGSVEPQLLEKDEIIQGLESEKRHLKQEIEKLRSAAIAPGGALDSRAKLRLERQRALAVKEVEYLRAQLKTFDTEELTMHEEGSHYDEQKNQQIEQLEKLVDEYRVELHKVHEALSALEKTSSQDEGTLPATFRGLKRPLSPADSDAESERISILTRKNRTLQESLSKSEQTAKVLRHELDATKSHLSSLQEQSRTRILELRANPTSEAENIKMTTLRALQAENRDLLAQLRGENGKVTRVIPVSTLDSLKLEMAEMERTVAEKEKRMRRLKEIWTAKSSEFREAVASVLGYKLDFLPNGRVRVTSMFHLSPAYRHGSASASSSSGPGSMGNGEENSIIFDGENGTMKISGGPNSLFALEIKHLIKFWVEERKDIPCFLAAMTLEFYDKTTRAARV
ncbi:M protein repeat protein [Talaromyces stipitatus ATCC 10500]|uniref:Spindle assembly checkpoint component MAD1 n=1 Tax=Talaromyces stipitatus (strain ATCC 10500 / CBS 375.48 / QM 6759 / NRRL 1006) TaxID=441959 RepID=B8M229_TALSN|nr:M protein repeat protein [Talaromyces stipitatus ATCC 10500]EED21493.1 M protein repeat protein [Talaromyces stipitatus ATCC 10500]